MDTGSIPCSTHGYDHLSRDPTCEFCKRALGPLYRHLSKNYGKALGDQTPTLSFDFSGPHPVAVTGARFMLLFVWRLDTVRLLWAFAVTGKTKECVRSCLNDVVAELNTYTGGSKPPVLRIHSDLLIALKSFSLKPSWSGLCITILNRHLHPPVIPQLTG